MRRPLLFVGLLLTTASAGLAQNVPEKPEERLAVLTESVADYTITAEGRAARTLTPVTAPLLRFDNPVGGVLDGVVMLWTDGGRPSVFGQVFVLKSGIWLHEFQSVASGPLSLDWPGHPVPWQPRKAGAEFKPVDGADAPAATRAARLIQMKVLARKFTAGEDFRVRAGDAKTTPYELRMLPSPAWRYPEMQKKPPVEDGAVFAFVHGTDPEVILLLESHRDGDKAPWQFACAPLTCWGVKVSFDGKQVWSCDEQYARSTKDGPYHIWGWKKSSP